MKNFLNSFTAERGFAHLLLGMAVIYKLFFLNPGNFSDELFEDGLRWLAPVIVALIITLFLGRIIEMVEKDLANAPRSKSDEWWTFAGGPVAIGLFLWFGYSSLLNWISIIIIVLCGLYLLYLISQKFIGFKKRKDEH